MIQFFKVYTGLFIVLVSLNSFACLSFPKKISLKNSSFESQVFNLPETDYGIAVEHNSNAIFFNHQTQQWCLLDRSVQDSKPQCINENQSLSLIDENEGPTKGKKVGVFQVSKGQLFLFSSSGSEKDTTKPYLRFSDSSSLFDRNKEDGTGKEKMCKSALKIEAVSYSKGTLGVYNIEAKSPGSIQENGKVKAPKMRGLVAGKQEDVVDLNGSLVSSESGCGGKTLIQNYSGSSSSNSNSNSSSTFNSNPGNR